MTSKVFKQFRPPISFTITMMLVALLFSSLGTWQLKRAAEKQVAEQQLQQANKLSLQEALTQQSRFARIEVSGHYDTARHLLLDNQIWQGRAGVYVFTPFHADSGHTILVNRGWLALSPDRRSMPEIPTPAVDIVLRGMLNELPVPGRILGNADQLEREQWPQLVTYLNHADISAALELSLENWIIQLSKSEPDGFEGREWKAVFLSSSRHKGYAFQWFALTAASIILWLTIGFRKPTGKKT